MKPKNFVARNVIVLNLSRRPDHSGDILPPELYATFKNPVPLLYNHDRGKVIGKAYLMRVKDTIVADIHTFSHIDDEIKAKSLLEQMYPAIGARIEERVGPHILKLEITAVGLSFARNADEFIEPLGKRVARDRKPVS